MCSVFVHSKEICIITCMRPNVALQQPRPGEGLAAVRTLAALTVGADVHRESRYRHVDFVAMGAPSGLDLGMCGNCSWIIYLLDFLLESVREIPFDRLAIDESGGAGPSWTMCCSVYRNLNIRVHLGCCWAPSLMRQICKRRRHRVTNKSPSHRVPHLLLRRLPIRRMTVANSWAIRCWLR